MQDITNTNSFVFRNPKQTLDKLSSFVAAGCDKIHWVIDWDGVMAPRHNKNATSWGVLRYLLPAAGKAEEDALLHYYYPKEMAHTMSNKDAKDWWNGSLNIYVRYHVDLNNLEQAYHKSGLKMRDGGTQLLNTCFESGMPTVILSAGVRNVIEFIADYHKMNPSIILASNFLVDENRRVVDWDKDSIINTLNKHEKGHPEISNIQTERPYTILIGDSIEDSRMVEGMDRVLRIRVCDTPKGHLRHEYEQETWAANYDVIVDKTLQPINDLLLRIIRNE